MAKAVTLSDLNENLIIQNQETEHVALETERVKMKVDDLSKSIGYLTETMILIQKEKDIEKQRAKARSGGKKEDSEGFFGGFGLGALAATLTKMVGSFGAALIGSVGVMFSTVLNDISHVLAAPLVLKPIAIFFDKLAVFSINFAKYGERMFNAIGKVSNFFFKAEGFFVRIGSLFAKVGEAMAKLPKFLQPLVGFIGVLGKVFKFLGVILILWDTVSTAMKGYERGGFLGAIMGAIGGFFGSLVGTIADLVLMIPNAIGAYLLDALGAHDWAESLRNFSVQELIEDIFLWLGSGETWATVIKNIQIAWNDAVDKIFNFADAMGEAIGKIWDSIKEWSSEYIVVPFQKMFSNVSDKLFDWGQLIKDTVLEIWDVIKSYFTNIGDKISKAASNIGTSITDFFTGGDKKSFKEVRAEAGRPKGYDQTTGRPLSGGTGEVSDPFSEPPDSPRLNIPQSKTQNPDKPYVFDSYDKATQAGALLWKARPETYNGYHIEPMDDGTHVLRMLTKEQVADQDAKMKAAGVDFFKDGGTLKPGGVGVVGEGRDGIPGTSDDEAEYVVPPSNQAITIIPDAKELIAKLFSDPRTLQRGFETDDYRSVSLSHHNDDLEGGQRIRISGAHGTSYYDTQGNFIKQVMPNLVEGLSHVNYADGTSKAHYSNSGLQMTNMYGADGKAKSRRFAFTAGNHTLIEDHNLETGEYLSQGTSLRDGVNRLMYAENRPSRSEDLKELVRQQNEYYGNNNQPPIIVNNTTSNTSTANQGFSVKANPWDSRDPFAGYN